MEVSDLHTHVSGVCEHSQGGSTSQEGTPGIIVIKLHHFMILAIAQEDAENRFWSEYLKAVEDYDTRLTDKWRADSDGVLVFVSLNLLVALFVMMTIPKAGLLSATIGIFIIESYKLLSPSSGDNGTP